MTYLASCNTSKSSKLISFSHRGCVYLCACRCLCACVCVCVHLYACVTITTELTCLSSCSKSHYILLIHRVEGKVRQCPKLSLEPVICLHCRYRDDHVTVREKFKVLSSLCSFFCLSPMTASELSRSHLKFHFTFKS